MLEITAKVSVRAEFTGVVTKGPDTWAMAAVVVNRLSSTSVRIVNS